jgi:hypothetical protein
MNTAELFYQASFAEEGFRQQENRNRQLYYNALSEAGSRHQGGSAKLLWIIPPVPVDNAIDKVS